MEHIGSDSFIGNYTKHKAMGIIGKVLETTTNSQGYAIPSLILVI